MWNRATCHHPYDPPTAAWLPRGSCHQALWPSAFAAPGLQPALCLHRQRSSIAACPLPAHSPLLLGHSSLPFSWHASSSSSDFQAFGHENYMLWASKFSCGNFGLSRPKQPFPHSRSSGSSHQPDEDGGARPLPSVRAPNTRRRLRRLHLCKAFRAGFKCARQLPPSSWPSAFQHCSLPFEPAHSPVLLGHSSLPFASLQTLKTPKTPKTLHRRCGTAPPATTLTILQLLHGFLAAAATKPSGRQPLLLQGCSLPFACT